MKKKSLGEKGYESKIYKEIIKRLFDGIVGNII